VVRLHVGHFRHASTRCIDQRNRIVVQPDGLLQRLKRLAANADGVACRVVIVRLAINGEQAVAVSG